MVVYVSIVLNSKLENVTWVFGFYGAYIKHYMGKMILSTLYSHIFANDQMSCFKYLLWL